MKRWLFIICTVFFTASMSHAADSPATIENFTIEGKTVKLARYAKSLIGPGNVRVDIAPYTIGDADGAILFFHGIESDWDGKAINHTLRDGFAHGKEYVTTYKGKEWTSIVTRPNQPDGSTLWALYVPGVDDEIHLIPSDGAAQLTNPRAIFEEYQAQKKAAAK